MLYWYPNRPFKLPPTSPKVTELSNSPDWDGEIKKNGTRLELWKSTTDAKKQKSYNDFIFWNRHKSVLTYLPSKGVMDELKSLNLPDNTYIDAELLHFKTKAIKHHIYIYDIYIYGGQQMMEELRYRRELLHSILRDKYDHLCIAQTYETGFFELYQKVIKNEEDEGLVMKNKKGKIVWDLRKSPDVWWQFKIRRESKNYKW